MCVAIDGAQFAEVTSLENAVCLALLRRLCLWGPSYAVEQDARSLVEKVDDKFGEEKYDD